MKKFALLGIIIIATFIFQSIPTRAAETQANCTCGFGEKQSTGGSTSPLVRKTATFSQLYTDLMYYLQVCQVDHGYKSWVTCDIFDAAGAKRSEYSFKDITPEAAKAMINPLAGTAEQKNIAACTCNGNDMGIAPTTGKDLTSLAADTQKKVNACYSANAKAPLKCTISLGASTTTFSTTDKTAAQSKLAEIFPSLPAPNLPPEPTVGSFVITTSCSKEPSDPTPQVETKTTSNAGELIPFMLGIETNCQGFAPGGIFLVTVTADSKVLVTNESTDQAKQVIQKLYQPFLRCTYGANEFYNERGDDFRALSETAIKKLESYTTNSPTKLFCAGRTTWGGEVKPLADLDVTGNDDAVKKLTDALDIVVNPPTLPGSAEDTTPTVPSSAGKIPNLLNTTDPNVVIGRLIKFLVGISGSLALVVFIYGGLMWVVSRGDAGYIKKGKAAMTSATIGLVIIFTSYIIVRLVIATFTSFG